MTDDAALSEWNIQYMSFFPYVLPYVRDMSEIECICAPNIPCLGRASPLSSITQLEGIPNKTWIPTVWVIPPKNDVSTLKLDIPPRDMCTQNSHCTPRSGGGQFVKMRRDLNVWEFRRGLPVPKGTW